MMRRLECNCCGGDAGRFRQWWNRDTGFGQCGRCTDWSLERGESLAHVRDMAGDPGVHRPQGELEAALAAKYGAEGAAALAGDAMRQAVLAIKGE